MKKKNNKWLSATLAACMVLGSVPAYSYSWPVLAAETAVQEAVADGEIDTSVEGQQTLRYYTNTETAVTSAQTKSERLSDFFYGTNSMKWSVDFKTSKSKLQALLALNTGNQYYALYIKGGKLALGGLDKAEHMQTTSTNYADDAWHTAVLEVKKNGKTTITVDGTNVLEKNTTSSMYIEDWQPAQFTVGGMTSYGSASQTAGWTYNGSMKNIVLTKTVAVTQTPVFETSNPGTETITTNAAALTTGAVNASYRLKKDSTGKVDLLTLADGAKLYLDPAAKKVGIQKKDNSTVTYDVANTALGTEKWHTLTLKVDGTNAEVLVDGVSAGSKAFSDTLDVSKLTFGSDIYCSSASVYNKELGEGQITDLHSGTASALYKDATPKMTGYYKTENRELFNSGYDGSAAYRIPAIVTSKKTGTVFASIDKRWNGGADVGVIDSVIRRSKDNGKTWGALQPVIDLSDSYGYTVDPALAVDNNENSEHYGRVYMLVDMFPSNIGFAAATQGNGYKEVNGQKYQVLTDSSNAEYTVRENGVVYDSQGTKTAYQVEVEDKQPFTARGELYKDGKRVGNIYKNSELKVQQTCYLWMTYSDDDGETWANPTDITPMVKADWMKFCGTGPGAGVQLKNGTIMFPVYCTNGNGKQSSFNVYSTDGGKTWNSGGSPNNGGDMQNASNELTESCIITLDNGHLMQFMRSYNGVVTTAVSTDNGLTWSETTKHSGIVDPYCQMSAVHYGTLTDPADNQQKEAIIFSNPAGGGRKGGKVRIAFVNADDTLTWAYSKLIEENKYVYSSLTVMQDGNIGLIYEQEAYAAIGAAFTSFSPQYIMDNNVYENTPTPTKIAATLTDASGKTVTELKEGTTITADVTFSQNVFAAGNVTLNVRVGDKVRKAQLEGNTTEDTLRFVYKVTAEDTGKVVVTGEVNTKDNGVAETVYNVSLSSRPITTKDVTVGSIASASETTFAELPTEGMTATAGSQYAASGKEGPASNVLDNDLNTHWHSKYNEDNASNGGRPKHWITIDLGGTYLVDSLKYTPRTGGLNGTITEYQIEVSSDGTNFTPVATGNWEKNADVKTAYFGGAVKATHVKLRAVDTKDEWATAAEIRVTGTGDLTAAADKTKVLAVLAEYAAYADDTEFTALADAVKEAKTAADKPNATADEIKTAADKVNAAVEAAGTLAKTRLEEKIRSGAEKVRENYTLSSWAAYAEALEAAKAVSESSTKAEILKAYRSLADAEAKLVRRSGKTEEITCDCALGDITGVQDQTVELDVADSQSQSVKLHPTATVTPCRVDGHDGTVVYTYAVKSAGETGATVTTDGTVTVKDAGTAVITVTATLSRKGKEALVKKKDVTLTVKSNKASAAEKKELQNEVASVAGQIKDKDNYTAESYQKLKDAVDAANRLLDSGTASKQQIAAAKQAIAEAKGKLVLKAETPKPAEEVKLDAPAVKEVKAKAAKGGVTVTVTVEPVKDAAAYDVYRVVKGKAVKVGTTAAGKTAVTDTTAIRGASYYAVAVSADGKTVSEAGAAVAVKLAKAPKIKKASAGTKSVKLTWKKAKGTKVVVYRSTKKNSGYKKAATSRKGAASLVNKKLKAGKTYYYKIAAVKGKTVSAMSKAKRVKIKK